MQGDPARTGGDSPRARNDDTEVLPPVPGGSDGFDEPAPLISKPPVASSDDTPEDSSIHATDAHEKKKDDGAPTSPAPTSTDSDGADPGDTHGRDRPIAWMVTAGIFFAIAATFVGLTIHLMDVAEQWEVRADDLTQINYEMGEDLVAEQETVLAQQQEMDLLNDQLSTLQQRVLDLADVVNQSDDNVATAQQQINVLVETIETGASVANSLQRCVDAQDQLAEYLSEAEEYDEDELAEFENSVDERCTAAIAANRQFQASLTP